jgi:hypothetical protein
VNKLEPNEAATASQVDFDFGQFHNRASPVGAKMSEGAALDVLDADCFSIPREEAQAWAEWNASAPATRGPEPKLAYTTRPACRNHHWGLIQLCTPRRVTVTFHTFMVNRDETETAETLHRVQLSEGSHRNQVFTHFTKFKATTVVALETKVTLSAISSRSIQPGIFATSIDTSFAAYPGSKEILELVMYLLWAVGFVTLFFKHCNFVRIVLDFHALWSRREEVKSRLHAHDSLLNVVDYTGENHYTTFVLLIVQKTLAMMILVSCMISLFDFFTYEGILGSLIVTKESTWCDREEWMTTFQYLRYCSAEKGFDWITLVAEYIGNILFHPQAYFIHMLSVLLLFGYAMCVFNEFEETAWVGRTVVASASRMKNFLPWFLAIILGFSFVFYTRFGATFPNFSTYDKAFFSLAFFSFSVPFEIEDGSTPLYYGEGMTLCLYLLAYAVCVLTIGINFFTTIVLDAYTEIRDQNTLDWHETNVLYLTPWIDSIFPNVGTWSGDGCSELDDLIAERRPATGSKARTTAIGRSRTQQLIEPAD